MFYTPEFHLSIVLVSKPLPLLIALWAMTSERMRQGMLRRETEAADINGGLLNKLSFWRRSRSAVEKSAVLDVSRLFANRTEKEFTASVLVRDVIN
jgi:hypothetical protein